jgi:hypothetical protein
MTASLLPATPDDIGPGWLTEVLAPRHPGLVVDAVEVVEVHEVTNTHARLRLDHDGGTAAPDLLFCKLPPLDPGRRETIARTGMGRREALFYASLAPLLDVRVPDAHAALHDERDGSFVLLLEDLTSSGCTVSDGPTGVAPDAAAGALEDLAAMHVRFEDPARRAAEAPWVQPTGPGSDYAVGMLQYGLDHHRDRLGDDFAAVAEVYIDRRHALHEVWHDGPLTVIHGDPHIGNVFDDHGRTGFLDWGIVNVGAAMRDVGYFLTMALTVDDRRRHERDLLRHYLDARAAAGRATLGFDEAWRQHRLQAAYTVPASCQVVTFPPDATERRRVFADAFLSRARAAVEDLDVRDALADAGV